MDKKLALSSSSLANINVGKKRKLNMEVWRDNLAKENRNSGQPYKGRNGLFHPGILPPEEGKVCGNCTKSGCNLTLEQKQQLFTRYFELTYDEQSAVLASCIEIQVPSKRTVDYESLKKFTCKYSVTICGRKYEVCKAGIMHIFKITSRRLRTIQKKVEGGEILPKDRRGTHRNRPHRVPEDAKEQVRNHIRSFPTYSSHYQRTDGDPLRQYLAPELSLGKMYDLYIELARENDLPECEDWIYRHILKTEFNLRFGNPKLDSCDTCDKYAVKLLSTNEEQRLRLIEERDLHHASAKVTYAAYKADD